MRVFLSEARTAQHDVTRPTTYDMQRTHSHRHKYIHMYMHSLCSAQLPPHPFEPAHAVDRCRRCLCRCVCVSVCVCVVVSLSQRWCRLCLCRCLCASAYLCVCVCVDVCVCVFVCSRRFVSGWHLCRLGFVAGVAPFRCALWCRSCVCLSWKSLCERCSRLLFAQAVWARRRPETKGQPTTPSGVSETCLQNQDVLRSPRANRTNILQSTQDWQNNIETSGVRQRTQAEDDRGHCWCAAA